MTAPKPLVLDVDGTFLKTDLLLESFWKGLGKAPLDTARAVVSNLGDRAALKAELARIAAPRVDLMPVNPEILALARDRQTQGGEVVLASAADRSLVEPLACHHGLGKRVFASSPGHNVKGPAKARVLVEAYGARGFDYAGNDRADIPVWESADKAILARPVRGAERALKRQDHEVTRLGSAGWRIWDLLRAIRPHQWVKNILLLMPMIAAHDFSVPTLLLVLLGMASFSAAASSIYLVNDLLDLEADRQHPTKCKRPLAAGEVPIGVAMAVSAGLAVLAWTLGWSLGPPFLFVLLLYMLLSVAYSLILKRMRWIDVFALAALYTLRMVAGAAAGGVAASIFMLIFVFPVFLSLGCVKRLTELARVEDNDVLPGRGYGRRDRGDLLNMAALGTVGALVVWGLYIRSPQGEALYPSEWIMWLTMVPIALWLIRMILLGYHGRQDYDPIVFALRDKLGIGLLLIVLSLMSWAAGLWTEWFGG